MRTSAHNIKAQDVEMGRSGPRRRLVPDSWSTSTSTLLLEAVVQSVGFVVLPLPLLLLVFVAVGACLCEIVTAPPTLRRLEGGRLHRLLSTFHRLHRYRPLICHAPLTLCLLSRYINSVHLLHSFLSLSLSLSLSLLRVLEKYSRGETFFLGNEKSNYFLADTIPACYARVP